MRHINFFIAGAKDLREHRSCFKELANDLTAEYRQKGQNVLVSVLSYENFGEVQDDYNAFIVNHSDAVIFILEDRIGSKTEQEFKLAAKKFNESGIPEIIVFKRVSNEKNYDLGVIEGLMGATIDKYYVEYNGIEDLKQKARERIRRLIDEINNKVYPTPSGREERVGLKKYLEYFIGVVALLLLSLLLLVGYNMYSSEKNPMILFMGGGSAANCIKERHHVDVKGYSGSMYVNMPSGSVPPILTEELLSPHNSVPHMVTRDSINSNIEFYPVGIVAKKVDEASFFAICGDRDQVKKSGRIISLYLGNDTLKVYLDKRMLSRISHESQLNNRITAEELASEIGVYIQNGWNVYATSANSGTYATYKSLLKKYDFELVDSLVNRFVEKSSSSSIKCVNNGVPVPYIILGSQCYKVRDIKYDAETVGLNVYDANSGEYAMKPTYIYFVVYLDNSLEDTYVMPENMVKLLNDLNVADLNRKVKNQTIKPQIDSFVVDWSDLSEYNK